MSSPIHTRFPRSSDRRHGPGYLLLLTGVDLYAPPGFQFRGQVVSAGAPFDAADLPRPAVAIENAGSQRIGGGRSRYAFADLRIIWHFDFDRGEWIEAARAYSRDASWTIDFAPLVERLLHPDGAAPAEDQAKPVTEQLAGIIDAGLAGVSREVCCYVLAGLHEHLSMQIARRVDVLTVAKAGYGNKATYPPLGQHLDAKPGQLRPRISVA